VEASSLGVSIPQFHVLPSIIQFGAAIKIHSYSRGFLQASPSACLRPIGQDFEAELIV